MRGRWLLLLILVLLAGSSLGQPISDPEKTNIILTIRSTPQLAPGERGNVELEVRNPYNWTMENVTLFAEVYAFVHRGEASDIAGLPNPPSLETTGTPSAQLELGNLPAGAQDAPSIAVTTSVQTPAGTVFTQGVYLLRFRLDFDYEAGLSAVMVSPGFFTSAEWAFATRNATAQEQATYRFVGFANYSFLGLVLGLPSIDGVLPDSGFGVKQPLPLWPFQLLVVGAGLSAGLAGYYFWRERRTSGKS
ncbi:MAG: hypothetical protein ACE5JE_05690 [Thermoplasmata archaeon]